MQLGYAERAPDVIGARQAGGLLADDLCSCADCLVCTSWLAGLEYWELGARTRTAECLMCDCTERYTQHVRQGYRMLQG